MVFVLLLAFILLTPVWLALMVFHSWLQAFKRIH